MPKVVGIALETAVVRAAYRDGPRTVFVEQGWDALAPERTVDALRAEIGNVGSIVLAIGLGFLEVARPELPAMPDAVRRRVLLRDADRYFPLEGALAIGTAASTGLAFATTSEQLQRWTRAFEEWAPVRAIVTGPDAIATTVSTAGSFLVDAGIDERGVLQISNNRVLEARRVPFYTTGDSTPASAEKGTTSLLTDGTEAAPAKYSAAVGALSFANAPLRIMLLDAALETALRSRRARRQWISYAAAALALLALSWSVDNRRDATLHATQHAVDSLRALAAPGLASRVRLAQLEEERKVLSAQRASAGDPLHVLAGISEALPQDAFVQRLEWDGKEWRLDGSVNSAASVVPHLESARMFSSVRVLGASTRFRDGARMRESFSVAFQAKGDSVARR